MNDALLAILKGLAMAFPSFAVWLAGILDGDDRDPSFSRRVRDILPERSASRDVLERLDESNASTVGAGDVDS